MSNYEMPCVSDVSSQSAGAVLSRNAASPAAESVHPLSPPADAAEPIRSMPRFRRTRRICPVPAESSAMIPDLSPLSPVKTKNATHPLRNYSIYHVLRPFILNMRVVLRRSKGQGTRPYLIPQRCQVSRQRLPAWPLTIIFHSRLRAPSFEFFHQPAASPISNVL